MQMEGASQTLTGRPKVHWKALAVMHLAAMQEQTVGQKIGVTVFMCFEPE